MNLLQMLILILCLGLAIVPSMAADNKLSDLERSVDRQFRQHNIVKSTGDKAKITQEIRRLLTTIPGDIPSSARTQFMNDYLILSLRQNSLPLAAICIENGAYPLTVPTYTFSGETMPLLDVPFAAMSDGSTRIQAEGKELALAMAKFLRWEIDPTKPQVHLPFSEQFYKQLLKLEPKIFREVLQDPQIEAAFFQSERMLAKMLQFSVIYNDVDSFKSLTQLIHKIPMRSPISRGDLFNGKIDLPNSPYHQKNLQEVAELVHADDIKILVAQKIEQEHTRVMTILAEAAAEVEREEIAQRKAEDERIQAEKEANIAQMNQLKQEMAALNQQVNQARQELQEAIDKRVVIEQEEVPKIALQMAAINKVRQEQEEQAKQLAFREKRIQAARYRLHQDRDEQVGQRQEQELAIKNLNDEHEKLKIEMDKLRAAQAVMAQQKEEHERIRAEKEANIAEMNQLQQEMAKLNQQVHQARQELQAAIDKKIVIEQEIAPQIALQMAAINKQRQEQEEQAKQILLEEKRIQSAKRHLREDQDLLAGQRQEQELAIKNLNDEHAKLKIEMDRFNAAQAVMAQEKAKLEQVAAQRMTEDKRIRAEKDAHIKQIKQLRQEMANLNKQVNQARNELQDAMAQKIVIEQENGQKLALQMAELNKLRQEEEEKAKQILIEEKRIQQARVLVQQDQSDLIAQKQQYALAMKNLNDEHDKLKIEMKKFAQAQAVMAQEQAKIEKEKQELADKKLLVEGMQKILVDRQIEPAAIKPICAAEAQHTLPFDGIYKLLQKSPAELEQALLGKMSECEDFVTYLARLNPNVPRKSNDVGLHYGKCVAKFPTLSGMFKPQCGDVVGSFAAADGRSELHERAAYVVDKMTNTNLVPPTVLRQAPIRDREQHYTDAQQVTGSLQLWLNETVAAKKLSRYERSVRLLLFDYLNGNCDRHLGNILLDKTSQNQEIAIDNGLAFNSGYCNAVKVFDQESSLEKELSKTPNSQQKTISNEIKKLLDGFNPRDSSFQAELCDELKYRLLSEHERLEFNNRLLYLHKRLYGRSDKRIYCTEQIDPIRPLNEFRASDCYDKQILFR